MGVGKAASKARSDFTGWVGHNGNVFLVAAIVSAVLWVIFNWGDQVGPTMLDTAVMAFVTAWITSKGAAIKKHSETVEARQAAVEHKVEELQAEVRPDAETNDRLNKLERGRNDEPR